MKQEKIQRINELAKKAKTEGLSAAEKAEQAELRAEYISAIKTNFRSMLENIEIKD